MHHFETGPGNLARGSRQLVSLLLVAFLVGQASAQEGRRHLLLAIVSADGLLVPFAIHDGVEWWNTWPFSASGIVSLLPLPKSTTEPPKDWLPPGVSLPTTWTLWQLTGAPRRVIRVRRFASAESGIMEMIGLQTDFISKRSEVSKRADGGDEAGIAVVGAGQIGRFVTLDERSSDWRVLSTKLQAQLETSENKALASWVIEGGSSFEARQAQVPSVAQRRASRVHVRLARTFRSDAEGTWYGLAASKQYSRRTSLVCPPTTEFQAIVLREPSGHLLVKSLSAFVTCEAHVPLDLLGVLYWSGPPLWIVRAHAEEGFDYGLLNPNVADPGLLLMKGLWDQRHGAS